MHFPHFLYGILTKSEEKILEDEFPTFPLWDFNQIRRKKL